MKIILFGGLGMLGNYVFKVLRQEHDVITLNRSDYDIMLNTYDELEKILNRYQYDIIINCNGAIPQKCNVMNFKEYIKINTLFPHKLNEITNKTKTKLIHISTDCVFNGKKGNYNELDQHDEKNIYGISKSLGEPENATVIRTSIIGENKYDKRSLLEWLLNNKNKKVEGYSNHYWNGITCLTLANIIKKIINDNLYWNGVRHIFSPNILSKYELCNIIKNIYDLNVEIEPVEKEYVNRSLNSIYKSIFEINDMYTQIKEQKLFINKYGKYSNIFKCRFCKNNLNEIIKFNDYPLSGCFLHDKSDILKEMIYPLTFSYCQNCKTGHIKEVIEEQYLFKNINGNGYFYYSSTIPTLVDHFKKLANKIKNEYPSIKNILEIGCNDGVFINNFTNKNSCDKKIYNLFGIDPSHTIKNIESNEITTINDYFNDNTCNYILNTHNKFDLIASFNCLAHIDNINNIYANIKKLLKDDGLIIIEVHYLKNIIDNMNFDFIYHEHMLYYSINTFIQICKNNDLYLDNIEFIENHGGSLRAYMHHKNNRELFYNIDLEKYIIKEVELEKNLNFMYHRLNEWRSDIMNYINDLKEKNIPLIGYGASGRTNMIINFLNIKFDEILDDSSYKINNYTPFHHIKIRDSKDIYKYKYNYKTIFILAWPYSKYIIKKHEEYIKNGGEFIIILPNIIKINKFNYFEYI